MLLVVHPQIHTHTRARASPKKNFAKKLFYKNSHTKILTVILYCAQSFQKEEAENFFLMTVVVPLNSAAPVPSWPPDEW